MFKYPSIVMCVLFCTATLAVLFSVLHVHSHDEFYYEELMAQNQLSKDQNSPFETDYRSQELTKEIWSNGLHMRVISPRSHVKITRSDQHIHIVEHLEKPVCLMQEKLFFRQTEKSSIPMQRIRGMQAQDASYNYVKGSLIASDATLQTYEIEGHILPPSVEALPLMQGHAQTVQIDRKRGRAFDFTATQLKMIFDMKKKI